MNMESEMFVSCGRWVSKRKFKKYFYSLCLPLGKKAEFLFFHPNCSTVYTGDSFNLPRHFFIHFKKGFLQEKRIWRECHWIAMQQHNLFCWCHWRCPQHKPYCPPEWSGAGWGLCLRSSHHREWVEMFAFYGAFDSSVSGTALFTLVIWFHLHLAGLPEPTEIQPSASDGVISVRWTAPVQPVSGYMIDWTQDGTHFNWKETKYTNMTLRGKSMGVWQRGLGKYLYMFIGRVSGADDGVWVITSSYEGTELARSADRSICVLSLLMVQAWPMMETMVEGCAVMHLPELYPLTQTLTSQWSENCCPSLSLQFFIFIYEFLHQNIYLPLFQTLTAEQTHMVQFSTVYKEDHLLTYDIRPSLVNSI